MVMHKGQKRATPEEIEHLSRVRRLPCCHCIRQKSRTQAHHIVQGRRLGHFYVIPLCGECHECVYRIPKVQQRRYWEQTNQVFGVTREWPASKILPRRVA